MESPRIFPFVRPWRNSTKQKSNKRCSLPPPPELGCSLFHNHVQKDIGLMNLTRGSNISESSENVKDKENKGIRLQEMLIKMEESLGLALTSGAKEKSIQYPPSAGPVESARMSPTNRHQGTVSSISIPKQTSPEPSTQTWTVFPRESRRTIIAVDTAVSSDDEESDLWPLPDNQPSTVPRFSAALPRFFPELSFTDFVSVSSIGASAAAHQQSTGLIGFSSNFETELRERVQTLYKDSANAVDILATDVNKALKQKTATLVPGSGIYLTASRLAIVAGLLSRVLRQNASRQPQKNLIDTPFCHPLRLVSLTMLFRRVLCELRHSSRQDRLNRHLAKVMRQALPIHRAQCRHLDAPRFSRSYRLTTSRTSLSLSSPVKSPVHLTMHRNHYAPYLQQRLVELEYGLADLTRDPHIQRRTLLVLDGPLQISRHSGDLVATRPAPAPPRRIHTPKCTHFLHAQVFPRNQKKLSPPLLDKDSKTKREDPSKHIKLPNPETSKLKDEAERRSRHSNANSNTTDKFSKTSRTDKPFTMAMRFFRRRNNTQAPNLEEPRLSVVLGLRPETSQPNPHAHIPAEAHLDRRPRGHDLRLHLHDRGLRISALEMLSDCSASRKISPFKTTPARARVFPSFCILGPTSQHHHPHPAQATASPSGEGKVFPLELRIMPPGNEEMLVANELVDSQRLRHTQACLDCAAEYYPASSRAYLRAPSNAALTAIIVVSMFMERTHIPVDLLVRLLDRLIMPIMAHIDSIDSLDDLFNFVLSISAFTKFSSVTI
ncbi:hypothetical protein N7522_001793 [Penicillium canescens]|nr:hypothetical protein N7522_001793 [Penicillium canescens]